MVSDTQKNCDDRCVERECCRWGKLALRKWHLSCTSNSPENTFQSTFMGKTVGMGESVSHRNCWVGGQMFVVMLGWSVYVPSKKPRNHSRFLSCKGFISGIGDIFARATITKWEMGVTQRPITWYWFSDGAHEPKCYALVTRSTGSWC